MGRSWGWSSRAAWTSTATNAPAAWEITWRDERIVLSGDAEAEGLSAWLACRPRRGPVRMLLFPHHGSDTDLIAPLLAALRPQEIWISTSGTPGVARELERRGIPCRTTALDGPLEL